MPLLRDGAFVTDPYLRLSDEDAIAPNGDIILPLARIAEAGARGNGALGVHVPNTVKPADLVTLFDQVALISVAFPAFNDGRGFSIARRLRRLGFKGVLRAAGPLIADQYAYATACGFDEIDVPTSVADRQNSEQWRKSAAQISLSYQRGYQRPATILDRRSAARKA